MRASLPRSLGKGRIKEDAKLFLIESLVIAEFESLAARRCAFRSFEFRVLNAISVQQRKPGNIKDKFRVYRFLSLFTQHFFDLV
jgi:hypothetical protein